MKNKERQQYLNTAIHAIEKKRFKSIFFIACGGSKTLLETGRYVCDMECSMPSFLYSAGEFILRRPKNFNENTLVITAAYSGSTPETIEATKMADETGALVVSLIGEEKQASPLAKATQYPIFFAHSTEEDASEWCSGMLYRLIFGMLYTLNSDDKYVRALKCIFNLNRVIQINKDNTYASADAFGKKYRKANMIYTMSSGSCYSVAAAFSNDLLEKLWIHSSTLHSGEFFYGPLEITEEELPVILIKNPGDTRPMDDRAQNFLENSTDNLILIDTAGFDWGGIDQDLQEYFAPVVTSAILQQYAQRIAEHKGHPLTVRRYMGKIDY